MKRADDPYKAALRVTRLLMLANTFLLAGCLSTRNFPAPTPGSLPLAEPSGKFAGTVEMRYLGSAGYLFRRGDHALITGPHYTNPHWLRVGLWRIQPDTALIDWLHPQLSASAVEAILVGHAHYDHLLDVPYIARKHHPQATVYGNPSAINLTLAAEPSLAGRVVSLDDEVSRDGAVGEWQYVSDGRIRFMALAAEHGPHAFKVRVMKGRVTEVPRKLPRSAWRWKEGETLTYLIDFMGEDRQTVDFRIYYADATTPGRKGLPPELDGADRHRIDLAILCVGSAHSLKGYPETFMDNYNPRAVVLGHWENFFRNPVEGVFRMRTTHLNEFIEIVEERLAADARWILPRPGSTYHLDIEPAPSAAVGSAD